MYAIGALGHSILWPVYQVGEKIQGVIDVALERLLHVGVFRLGIRDQSPCNRFLVDLFQRMQGGSAVFDPKRLNESRKRFGDIGGIETTIISPDGANVTYMVLKSADFFKEIERRGGSISTDDEGKRYIDVEDLSGELSTFLRKFKLLDKEEKRTHLSPDFNTKDKEKPPFMLISNSPGTGMLMDPGGVARWLSAGFDLCIWDPRGKVNSKGAPSEGGYYLDLETVIRQVKDQARGEFYLSGYCLGAAISVSALENHPDFNCILENPFASALGTIEKVSWLGWWRGSSLISTIQTTDSRTLTALQELNITQTNFNLVEQLDRIKTISDRKFIVISTNPDGVVPEDTVENLKKAIDKKRDWKHIERQHSDPKIKGHMVIPTRHYTVMKDLAKEIP